MVNHPPHYTSHPSGIECIDISEHLGFNLGNAFKYIFRRNDKGSVVENLKKALWYVEREYQYGPGDRPYLDVSFYRRLNRIASYEDRKVSLIMNDIALGYVNRGCLGMCIQEIKGLIQDEEIGRII